MDEIDSIGSAQMESGSGNGDSEVQRTMLELLNQLDGFEASNKIKVCYRCNRAPFWNRWPWTWAYFAPQGSWKERPRVGLLNADGYYNSLLSFIDKAVEDYVPRHERVASMLSWEMEQFGYSKNFDMYSARK